MYTTRANSGELNRAGAAIASPQTIALKAPEKHVVMRRLEVRII
jgi:hypothetical protein